MRARRLKPALPALEKGLKFTPNDFRLVLANIPEDCPLVGGQAVAWWANRYNIRPGGREVTSRDIDFWGSREDLTLLASRLKRPAIFPNAYEMTVWVGAVELSINGKKSLAEIIHTVPGLDTNEPEQASVLEQFEGRKLYVLSPVSLVLAKLHALRHFDQADRQDEEHLRVCLESCRHYLGELLAGSHVRVALREVERLITAQGMKAFQKLEKARGFKVLSAIPIERFQRAAKEAALSAAERERLQNFLRKRWPSVSVRV